MDRKFFSFSGLLKTGLTFIASLAMACSITACTAEPQGNSDDTYHYNSGEVSGNTENENGENTSESEVEESDTKEDDTKEENTGTEEQETPSGDENENAGEETQDPEETKDPETSGTEDPEQSDDDSKENEGDESGESGESGDTEQEEVDYSSYVAYKDENGNMQVNLDVMTNTFVDFLQNENYYGVTYEKLYTQGAITDIDYSAYDSTNDKVILAGRSENTSTNTKYMFYVGADCSIGTENVTVDDLYSTLKALYYPKNFTYGSNEYLTSDKETLSTDDQAFVDAVKVIIQQNNTSDTILCTYVTDYEYTGSASGLGNTQTWVAYTINLSGDKITLGTNTIRASTQLGEGNAVNNILKNNSDGLYYNVTFTDLLENVNKSIISPTISTATTTSYAYVAGNKEKEEEYYL